VDGDKMTQFRLSFENFLCRTGDKLQSDRHVDTSAHVDTSTSVVPLSYRAGRVVCHINPDGASELLRALLEDSTDKMQIETATTSCLFCIPRKVDLLP
jgi:hypothetical protein